VCPNDENDLNQAIIAIKNKMKNWGKAIKIYSIVFHKAITL
jgi:hypothetical protein